MIVNVKKDVRVDVKDVRNADTVVLRRTSLHLHLL